MIVDMCHVSSQRLIPDDVDDMNEDDTQFPTTLLEETTKDIRKCKDIESMDPPHQLVQLTSGKAGGGYNIDGGYT